MLSRCRRELVTLDRHTALADAARAVLEELGYYNVEVRHGDGAEGAPDRAPFHGIAVTAASAGDPPAPLLDQLAPDGILVCPVHRGERELLSRFSKDGEGEALVPVRFVPLVRDG